MIGVISDLHLTAKFDDKKNQFLMSLVDKFDTIIISGDFIDGFNSTWKDVYASNWRVLLEKLQKKKAVVLIGNHDPSDLEDSGMLWKDRIYRVEMGGQKYLITHGDVECPGTDKWRKYIGFELIGKIIHNLTFFKLEPWGVKKYGEKFLNIFSYKMKDGEKLKRFVLGKGGQEIWVFGHTHIAGIPLKERFINSGSIDNGYASWVEITARGVELKKEGYFR